MDLHELAEERSIAMHAAISDQIRREPAIVDRARERMVAELRLDEIHPDRLERT